VTLVWTGATCGLVFGALHFAGLLRVSPEEEDEGLDTAIYGEAAYPEIKPADLKAVTMEAAAAATHALTHGNTIHVDTRKLGCTR